MMTARLGISAEPEETMAKLRRHCGELNSFGCRGIVANRGEVGPISQRPGMTHCRRCHFKVVVAYCVSVHGLAGHFAKLDWIRSVRPSARIWDPSA